MTADPVRAVPPTEARPARAAPEALRAHAAALATLPGLGLRHLAALVLDPGPVEAWARVVAGRPLPAPPGRARRPPDPGGSWAAVARRLDVGAHWAGLGRRGIDVVVLGAAGYPPALAEDPEPPGVLFWRGDLGALDAPLVAVVGTRRASGYGRRVAHELGLDLAAAGVGVVSGLALGVDGAAHRGALAGRGAAPVGVVGSGLDVVYPRTHAELWSTVAAHGLLASEAPPDAAPEPWRFPVRNRILAALAGAVVVVESPAAGGSVHTVEAALARDRPVMAVPGPVTSACSALPNQLLAEGAAPARDATDVLVALGLAGSAGPRPPPAPPPADPADPAAAAVLDALGWDRAGLEELVVATGLPAPSVAVALADLERTGWVAAGGGWWERAGPPTPAARGGSGSPTAPPGARRVRWGG